MFEEIIEYEECQEACSECFGFSGVTFKQDFGPYKKGETVPVIWFEIEESEVKTSDDEGNTLKEFKFKIIAV